MGCLSGGYCNLFDDGVPLIAAIALASPFWIERATGLAGVGEFWFGHFIGDNPPLPNPLLPKSMGGEGGLNA